MSITEYSSNWITKGWRPSIAGSGNKLTVGTTYVPGAPAYPSGTSGWIFAEERLKVETTIDEAVIHEDVHSWRFMYEPHEICYSCIGNKEEENIAIIMVNKIRAKKGRPLENLR